MKYEAGTMILVQHGEYSDQSTVGLFGVNVAFDGAEKITEYKSSNPGDEDGWYDDDGDGFLNWLASEGLVTELDYSVFHIGCYGRLETY